MDSERTARWAAAAEYLEVRTALQQEIDDYGEDVLRAARELQTFLDGPEGAAARALLRQARQKIVLAESSSGASWLQVWSGEEYECNGPSITWGRREGEDLIVQAVGRGTKETVRYVSQVLGPEAVEVVVERIRSELNRIAEGAMSS